MTKAPSSADIAVQLTAMQIPDALPIDQTAASSPWALEGVDRAPRATALRLTPGETSELLIQIRNTSRDPLHIGISTSGNFPNHWSQLLDSEGSEILPGRTLEKVIHFRMGRLPADAGVAQPSAAQRSAQPPAPRPSSQPSAAPQPAAPQPTGPLPPQSGPQSAPQAAQQDAQQPTPPAIPSDHDLFEDSTILYPRDVLQLDYQGQVQVHRLDPHGHPSDLIGHETFNLYLRPHSLYPEFLPALYREVDFIGRLLKLFEQSFEPSVTALQSLWAYFDPRTTPEALLPFLAYWVGWPGQVPWNNAQQRRLIHRALEIYRTRGTRTGLSLYLHLYTGLPNDDRHIQILESFTRGFELGSTSLGRTSLVGGGRPFHFSVNLRSPTPEALSEELIRTIIEQEKPAFCSYDLTIGPLAIEPLTVDPLTIRPLTPS